MQLYGINGEYSHVQSESQMLNKIRKKIKKEIINLTNISSYEYNQRHLSNWWIYGDDAIKFNLAHKIIRMLCNYTKKYIYYPHEDSIGALVKHQFHICPLLVNPIKNTGISYNFTNEESFLHIYNKKKTS